VSAAPVPRVIPEDYTPLIRDEATTVFVRNLPFSVDEAELTQIFAEFGDLKSARIARDHATGKSKGYGYVDMGTEDNLERALTFNGRELGGRPIEVRRSVPPKKTDDSPDSHTLFARNLPFAMEEADVKAMFEEAGEVTDVRLVREHGTGRSKGYAYVDMATAEGEAKGLEMNGRELAGRAIQVQKSTPFRREGQAACTLYVSNLAPEITEENLRKLFDSCGEIKEVRIVLAPDGTPKGFCYVEFSSEGEAAKALLLNHTDLGGKPIKVAISNPPKRAERQVREPRAPRPRGGGGLLVPRAMKMGKPTGGRPPARTAPAANGPPAPAVATSAPPPGGKSNAEFAKLFAK